MPIVVNSPFSGRPIKVRDQDIGRAIRDEEGRIFYVVPRASGDGYYAAPTRKGSAKDEQRYDDMAAKGQVAHETFHEQSAAQVHDATGRKRGSPILRLIFILLLVLIAAAAAYFFIVLEGDLSRMPGLPQTQTPGSPTQNHEAPPADAPAPQSAAPPAAPFALGHGPVPVAASASLELQTYPPPPPDDGFTVTASGLRYRVDAPGDGPAATAGSYVRIRYEARLPGGPVIDATPDDAEPFGFVLWSGQAIRGWDEGIAGMQQGETRTLIIPGHLITGARSTQGNPSNQLPPTTLQCRIELVAVHPGVGYTVDTPGEADGRIARPGDRVAVAFTARVEGHDQPFSSSDELGGPLRVTLGAGQVITGWELGVIGMAEGETRTLTIPPYLAYGERGFGEVIPPHATLLYTVTLEQVAD